MNWNLPGWNDPLSRLSHWIIGLSLSYSGTAISSWGWESICLQVSGISKINGLLITIQKNPPEKYSWSHQMTKCCQVTFGQGNSGQPQFFGPQICLIGWVDYFYGLIFWGQIITSAIARKSLTYFQIAHRGQQKMKTPPRKREQNYSRQNNGQISNRAFIYWMCFLLRACLHPQDLSMKRVCKKHCFQHGYPWISQKIWKYEVHIQIRTSFFTIF